MLPLINSIPRTSTVIVELVASWQAGRWQVGRWQVGGRPSVNQHKTTWSTVRYDFSTYSHNPPSSQSNVTCTYVLTHGSWPYDRHEHGGWLVDGWLTSRHG